jgi:hypothetical protein
MRDRFNALTGRSGRHNLALGDVTDWLATLHDFLAKYQLRESSSGLGSLLEKIGEAKFDLTTITYRARATSAIAGKVRGVRVAPLVADIVDNLEDIRRALINPSLGGEVLHTKVPALRESFEKLQEAISATGYK